MAEQTQQETVICDVCGQAVPLRDCHQNSWAISDDGMRRIYVCKTHQQERAAQQRRELTEAKELWGERLFAALQLSMTLGAAPAGRVRAAVQAQEEWTRAMYGLLRDKMQRAVDEEYDEDDGDGDDIPITEDYYPWEYLEELERLLNTVIDTLTRTRRLSEPTYEPSGVGTTQLDALRAISSAFQRQSDKRALEEWRRQPDAGDPPV